MVCPYFKGYVLHPWHQVTWWGTQNQEHVSDSWAFPPHPTVHASRGCQSHGPGQEAMRGGQGQSRMSRVQDELSFLTFHFQVLSDSGMEGESYSTTGLPTKSWAILKSRWKTLNSMICLSRHSSFLKPLDSCSLLFAQGPSILKLFNRPPKNT